MIDPYLTAENCQRAFKSIKKHVKINIVTFLP